MRQPSSERIGSSAAPLKRPLKLLWSRMSSWLGRSSVRRRYGNGRPRNGCAHGGLDPASARLAETAAEAFTA
ncbi:MAG TPA: hypothetical protein VML36_04985, partial [Nitrospiria bacterium]|nr:hypothetical protein [Nitrospiria bacterium]